MTANDEEGGCSSTSPLLFLSCNKLSQYYSLLQFIFIVNSRVTICYDHPMFNRLFALLCLFSTQAVAWDEERVIDFILSTNALLIAHHSAISDLSTTATFGNRFLDNASYFGKISTGGTDFRDEDLTMMTGIKVDIPVRSTQERRRRESDITGHIAAVHTLNTQIQDDLAALRQSEAELVSVDTRVSFVRDKTAWLKERVDQGTENVSVLWEVTEKKTELEARKSELDILIQSQRHKVARYADSRWRDLLAYLDSAQELPEV